MTSIPSKVHNWTSQPQIWSSSAQMTLIPIDVRNLHSTTSNQVLFDSNDLNTLKCAQLRFTTSNQVTLILSNVHNCTLQPLSLQTPIDAQTYTNAHPTLSTPKASPSTKTSQDPLLNQLTIKSLNSKLALMGAHLLKHNWTKKQIA